MRLLYIVVGAVVLINFTVLAAEAYSYYSKINTGAFDRIPVNKSLPF